MIPASFVTNSPDETIALGARLGATLRGGESVALDGMLGAGKTQFTKGIARGLAIPQEEPIVSPTFVLIREYAGRLTLFHLDVYRLHDDEELVALGFDEMRANAGSVVVVEWAARIAGLAARLTWRVEIRHRDESTRELTISGPRELVAANAVK